MIPVLPRKSSKMEIKREWIDKIDYKVLKSKISRLRNKSPEGYDIEPANIMDLLETYFTFNDGDLMTQTSYMSTLNDEERFEFIINQSLSILEEVE